MKLKDKAKGKFNIKTLFGKGKSTSIPHTRRPIHNSTAVGDFSLRLGKSLKGNKKQSKKWKVILKRTAIFASLSFLFLMLIGILVLLGVVSSYSKDLPNVDKYFAESTRLGKETIIQDRNGTELYRLRGDVVNERLTIDEVPDKLEWAFLSAEDANFYSNKGLDIFGLTRALGCIASNYIKKTSTEACGGGSSITQQLVKKTTLGDERSLDRKIKEAILATRVADEYSKEQVLEYYLNITPEGREYVGAKTGSVYLFGKSDMSKLTLAEMAYIAGIPNNPEVFSPRGAAYDPEQSQARAIYVLDRMYEVRDRSKVTKEEIDAAKAEVPNVVFVPDQINKKAPHFVNQVISELDNDPKWKDQVAEGKKGSDYFRDKGYTIVTAVDLPTQELLEKTLRDETIKAQPALGGRSFVDKSGAQDAAGVVMDVKSGEVLAMVGSRDFYATSTDKNFAPQFNAAASERSMGSSVKPILYMTSFTKGYNPLSIVPDIDMFQAPGYKPKNFDQGNCHYTDASRTGKCDFLSVRQALRYSLNQPAVSMANIVGPQEFGAMYGKLTGRQDMQARFQGPSAALGAANIALVDQTHAYATIADMGNYKPKKYILYIKDDKGNIIYDNKKVESTRVIDAKYPYIITDLNEDYWFLPTDATAKEIRKTADFAGKTGTSDTDNGPGDIVFMGYTPDIAVGVWAGNSCPPTECFLKKAASSDDVYKYLFVPFIKEFSKNTTFFKSSRFQRPEGVRTASICNLTGNAYSEDCARAGGRAIQDLVADTSLPKSEFMIEGLTVVPCPDNMKLARDVDKDAGLAQNRSFVRYDKIFASKFLADQVLRYLQARNGYPSGTCDIPRTLEPPSVTVNNPPNGSSYSKNETLSINGTVTSSVAIAKVEVLVNNQIVGTFTSGQPIQVSKPLNAAPFTTGSNTIKIVATNVKNEATSAQSVITIYDCTSCAFILAPLSSPLNRGIIQLQGRVVNGPAGNFSVTGAGCGTVSATSFSGGIYSASWTINNAANNCMITFSAGPNAGPVQLTDSVNIKIN